MPEPLRVAVVARAVAPLHGHGGLERSVHDLVRHLAARGVSVTLITPPPRAVQRATPVDPFGSTHIRIRHVPYVTFPFANRRGTTILDRGSAYLVFGLRAGRTALDLVRAGEVDVVHGFGASALGYALARRRHRAPLVLNPQGLEEFGATGRLPWLKRLGYLPLRLAVRRTARAADCIIATDRALEATVERHLGPAPGRMRTIPNGIDLVAVSALAGPAEGRLQRRRFGLTSGETVLLSVGRLDANKGFDRLAAALGRVRDRAPFAATGWRWVVVGAGPARRTLERAVVSHGLEGRVVFAGRASDEDLHAWYEAATLFVHPTRYEGSSLVTLEAMAHRRAVITTAAGGLPDKVRPGVNGWLVPPDDEDALAAALLDAAADPGRLAAMGARGREIVEREFSWAELVDRQIAVYRELIGRA